MTRILFLLSLVTIAWDPNPVIDHVSGYIVLVWRGTAPTPTMIDVSTATQTTIDLAPADHVAVVAYRSALVCFPIPDPTPVTCVPELSQALNWTYTYFMSYPSARVIAPSAAPDDPACLRPLGNRAVSIFVTKLQFTGSGGPGSQARLDFQLASPNSPITSVAIAANNTVLRSMSGTDVAGLAGMWFTVPTAPGIYPLEVRATNLYGCTATQRGTLSITVP
jgi:hypothetical protein